MKKTFAIGTLLALIAAASAFANTSTRPAGASATTISFSEHEVSDKSFNLGSAKGIRPGFIELSASDDMQGSTQIGHDGGSCVITRRSAGTEDDLCDIVFVFPEGQIDANGLVRSTPSGPGTFTVAIVGGTGIYAHASGEATVQSSTRTPRVTLHITR